MQFLLGLPHSLSFSSASLFPVWRTVLLFLLRRFPGLPHRSSFSSAPLFPACRAASHMLSPAHKTVLQSCCKLYIIQ